MKNIYRFILFALLGAVLTAIPMQDACISATTPWSKQPKPQPKPNPKPKPTVNTNNGKSGNTGKKPGGNTGNKSGSITEKERQRKIAQAINGEIIYYDDKNNEIIYKDFRYRMVQVPGGTFIMGATAEQGSDADSYEKPTHSVTLSTYRIGATEVPQWLWLAVMGSNPSYWKGDNLPVEQVSWNDCMEFISRLNLKTGKEFRLPTEAEWEYAAHGGRSGGTKYSGSDNIFDVAWFEDNSDKRTHEVGTKRANSLGLYDMSGNVWEWCADWYGKDYYSNSPQSNPKGPSSGSYRVNRGGSCLAAAGDCRVAIRRNHSAGGQSYSLGLRLGL